MSAGAALGASVTIVVSLAVGAALGASRWRGSSVDRTSAWLRREGVAVPAVNVMALHDQVRGISSARLAAVMALWVASAATGVGGSSGDDSGGSPWPIVATIVLYAAVTVIGELIWGARIAQRVPSQGSGATATVIRRSVTQVVSDDVLIMARLAAGYFVLCTAGTLALVSMSQTADDVWREVFISAVAVSIAVALVAVAGWLARRSLRRGTPESTAAAELARAASVSAVVGAAAALLFFVAARGVDAAYESWWDTAEHGPPLWWSVPMLPLFAVGATAPVYMLWIAGAWSPINSSRLARLGITRSRSAP